MKPELLILEGVYSYRNRTEIDFSTLCSADLFGIFGNVGSGKSAVLEAITYVLYGKIERLSNRVYYNMMNLASNRMYIDFTFESRGNRYRFTFETRRNKKDFDKIETPQRSAYVMDGSDWLPLFDRDGSVSADEILGLSYDNFRRTVIVPQGKFQEFLHLEQSKRTAMLMELFKLDRFDLYSRAASLSNRNNEKTAAVEGELSGLSDVNEDRLEEAEKEAESLKRKSSEIGGAVEESDKKLHELRELEALDNQLSAAREALSEKTSESESFAERKAGLRLYEECVSRFKSGIDILTMRVQEAEEGRLAMDAAGMKMEEASKQLVEAEKQLAEASEEYAKIEDLQKKSGWFEELAGLFQAREDARRLQVEIESGRTGIEAAEAEKTAVDDGLNEIRAELNSPADGEIPAEQMEQLKGIFDSLENTSGSISECERGLEAVRAELTRLDKRLEEYSGLDHEEAELSRKEDMFRARQLDSEVRKGLEQLADQLENGKPCPLCGSLEHPAPAAAASEAEELSAVEAEALKTERAALKKRFEEYSALNTEAAGLQGRLAGYEEQHATLKDSLNGLVEKLRDTGYGAGDNERFRVDYEKYKQKRSRLDALRKESARFSEEQERLNSRISKLKDSEVRLRLELTGVQAGIDSSESKIDDAVLEQYGEAPPEDLLKWSSDLNLRIREIRDRQDAAEERRKAAAARDERSRTQFELLESRAFEQQKSRQTAEAELEELISKSGYSNIDEVRSILNRSLDTEAERAEIEAYDSELAGLKNEVAGLEIKMNGRVNEPEELKLEVEKNRELRDGLEEIISRRGELVNKIDSLRTRLIRRSELEEELEKLRVRGENLKLLKNLFTAKKFINYAATIYLHELCEAANVRFRKLTRESLRLELDDGNNFIIRDYLNEGKTRSVKTLSGGQTFQAAFSLSLALADSIGPERSGFFFLDEGFGSLDRESLSLVFDSLKSLKKEKRTVGVISHVEELKQEIDTFITVTRDNEEGSIIKNSWKLS